MAFCPNCDMDGWHEENYSPEHDENAILVYWRCRYCGARTEGYWTSEEEIESRWLATHDEDGNELIDDNN